VSGYADRMLAANIWHWWIGVAMLIVGILLVAALVAGYLKSVTAQQFPPERRQRASKQDL
jgi:hypothetical protein